MERLAQEAEDARSDVEARLVGMTAALDEHRASLAAAAAEVHIQLNGCAFRVLALCDCTRFWGNRCHRSRHDIASEARIRFGPASGLGRMGAACPCASA